MWKAGENSPLWKSVKHLVEDIENINSRFKVKIYYFNEFAAFWSSYPYFPVEHVDRT